MEKKVQERFRPMWVLKSLLVSYVVTSLMLLLLTFLVYKFDLDEKKVRAGIIMVYVLSTFMGGWIVGKLAGARRLVWGALLGILYFLLLLFISLGVYRTLQSEVHLAVVLALCAGGGALGGMLS